MLNTWLADVGEGFHKLDEAVDVFLGCTVFNFGADFFFELLGREEAVRGTDGDGVATRRLRGRRGDGETVVFLTEGGPLRHAHLLEHPPLNIFSFLERQDGFLRPRLAPGEPTPKTFRTNAQAPRPEAHLLKAPAPR